MEAFFVENESVLNSGKKSKAFEVYIFYLIIILLILGAEDLLKEDESKEACRRFMSTGECSYGIRCRHSHITPAVRQQLIEQGTIQFTVSQKRTKNSVLCQLV